jgi:hypothetical protein
MRFTEAHEGWNQGRLTQEEAARLLEMSDRARSGQPEITPEESRKPVQHPLLLCRMVIVLANRETGGSIFVMAASVVGIAPSRKAFSTNVLVSPGLRFSSAMMRSSSPAFFWR